MRTFQKIQRSFLLITLIAISNIMTAQGPPPPKEGPPPPPPKGQKERRENIESQKIAFITKKLDLTPEEAQAFWPVYNQFQEKMKELRKKRREDIKEAKTNFDALTDKEVEQLVDNEIIFRQKEIDIQKEFHAKFKAILPIKKVAKLYEAEENFKRYLLNQLKDKPPVKD